MKRNYFELPHRTMRLVRRLAVPTLMIALAVAGLSAPARAATSAGNGAGATARSYHVLYLKGVVRQNDALDIETDLRNLLPRARIYYVRSRNAISMMSTQHDFALAQKVVADMSQGARVFRLTYTFTHAGGGKDAAHRSVAVVVASGERASIKQGEKVPLVTGRDSEKANGPSQQYQYIDVGLNLNVSLRGPADDLVLQTKVAESAVVPDKSVAGLPDPVIRQTALDNTSIVSIGKPLVIGSIEVPGTTKHEQIEVTAEAVK